MPRTIILYRVRCLQGRKFGTFLIENNNEPIYAPVNDQRAVGLADRLIQTIK